MSSYHSLAQFYDLLTSNISYENRGKYFQDILLKYDKSDGILVDLGCGTGSLCEVMSSLGFDVIGIDSSVDMLNMAMDKRYDSGLDIMYLCQDMAEIDLYGTMDVCISALDTLNHVVDFDKLKRVFAKVSLFLHPDGLFIFDVNTIYKHHNVLADNVFIYDYDEVYCAWQNNLQDSHVVDISLELFCRDDDNRYTRMSENFSERAYSHDEILELIGSTDLELVDFYADDSFDKPQSDTERVVYVVKSNKW